jgi:YhcH/YjgK/YiaL family protein
MYLGNLKQQAVPPWFPEILRTMLAFMAGTDFRAVPSGKLLLPGVPEADAYCSVQRYPTQAAREMQPEAHRLYADVHLLVQGREAIGWAPLQSGLAVSRVYDPAGDIEFFHAAPGERLIQLEQDDYLLADVDDLHKPRCLVGESAQVLKVVGKIRSRLLRA